LSLWCFPRPSMPNEGLLYLGRPTRSWRKAISLPWAALAFCLFGCHLDRSVHAATRSRLRDHLARNCSVQTVSEHAGLYGTPRLQHLRLWFYDRLLRSGRVHVVWQRDFGWRSFGELSYGDDGQNYRIWWNDLHPKDSPGRRSFALRTCLFAPRSISVVSADLGEARDVTRVTFFTEWRYSWIAGQLSDLGLLTGNNTFLPRDTSEDVVQLPAARA
jgi:hypothetical protein